MSFFGIVGGGLALGVYADATKNKIGKISGEAASPNRSAGAWAALSFLWLPVLYYLMKRKMLLARAQEHPVETQGVLRKNALICCTSGLMVFLGNLQIDDTYAVKAGLLAFNQNLTVGDAFDNNKYFLSTSWESGSTENGIKLVEVHCDVDLEKHPKGQTWASQGCEKAEATFQFTVSANNESFEASGFRMDFFGSGGRKRTLDWTKGEALLNLVPALLEDVYNNEPLSINLYNDVFESE